MRGLWMFLISTEQMAVFGRQQRERFEDRVFLILAECWKEKVASRGTASVRDLIRTGIERASSYGLRSEREAFTYVNLMLLLGDDFDRDGENDSVAEILADSSIEHDDKIDMILQEIPETDEPMVR